MRGKRTGLWLLVFMTGPLLGEPESEALASRIGGALLAVGMNETSLSRTVAGPMQGVAGTGEEEDFSDQLFLPIVSGRKLPGDAQLVTSITILNTSSAAVFTSSTTTFAPAIQFLDHQGNKVAADEILCPPVEPTGALGPGQVRRFQTRATDFGGWARITWAGDLTPRVEAEIAFVEGARDACEMLLDQVDSRNIRSKVRAAAGTASKLSALPASLTRRREVAVSIVNPSLTRTAHITLQAIRDDGRFLDVNEFKIGPGERVSDLLFGFLIRGKVFIVPPVRPNGFRGQVRVVSDSPVAVGAIDVFFPEGRWGNVPVFSIPPR